LPITLPELRRLSFSCNDVSRSDDGSVYGYGPWQGVWQGRLRTSFTKDQRIKRGGCRPPATWEPWLNTVVRPRATWPVAAVSMRYELSATSHAVPAVTAYVGRDR
jgi:hypothetical protein